MESVELLKKLTLDSRETLVALRRLHKQGIVDGHRKLANCAGKYPSSPKLYLPANVDLFCKPVLHNAGLQGLKRVTLSELTLNKWHRGTYVQGFLREPSFRYLNHPVGILEDDESSKAARIVLGPCWGDWYDDPQLLLPQDAEVIIKEPCLVQDYLLKGTYLWVANPASFNIVSHFPSVRNNIQRSSGRPYAPKLRALGDEHFMQDKLLPATELYTLSLKVAEEQQQQQQQRLEREETLLTLSNRSQAWLKLRRYTEALADAERVLSLDPLHAKSLHVKVEALWGMQQYHLAFKFLDEQRMTSPSKELQSLHRRAEILDEQSRLGTHDLSKYYLSGCGEDSVPELAEFVGPVTIGMTSSAGRGLFLTKDVRSGDCLLVTNPLCVTYMKNVDGLSLAEDAPIEELAYKLSSEITRLCMNSPRTLQQVYTGAERAHAFTTELLEKPAPDVGVFKPNWDISLQVDVQQLDVGRIYNIVPYVWDLFVDYSVCSAGSWLLPAFINHSCLPNVSIRRIGETKVVYASRDMKAGDELLRSYYSALSPRGRRQGNFEFTCVCPRCRLERRLEARLGKVTERYDRIIAAGAPVCRPSLDVVREFAGIGLDVEKVVAGMEVSREEKSWLRASYAYAYAWYFYLSSFEMDVGGSSEMPSSDEVVENFHATAPGDQETLDMMILCKLGEARDDKLKAVGIWKRECTATFGHLREEVMNFALQERDLALREASPLKERERF